MIPVLLLIVVLSPVLGLVVARSLGPVGRASALGAAILGELIGFGGFAIWIRARLNYILNHPRPGEAILINPHTSLSGRLTLLVALVLLASLEAGLFLIVQSLVSQFKKSPAVASRPGP